MLCISNTLNIEQRIALYISLCYEQVQLPTTPTTRMCEDYSEFQITVATPNKEMHVDVNSAMTISQVLHKLGSHGDRLFMGDTELSDLSSTLSYNGIEEDCHIRLCKQRMYNVEPSEWTFHVPKINTTCPRFVERVGVNSPTGEQITIQLSQDRYDLLSFPFGVGKPVPGDLDTGEYPLFVSLEGNESLKDFIVDFDEIITEAVCKNMSFYQYLMNWFKRPFTFRDIQHMYCSPLRKCENGYPSILRVRVDYRTDVQKSTHPIATHTNDELVSTKGDLSDIIPGSKAMITVNINGIWINLRSMMWGVTLNAQHVLLDCHV